MSLLNCHSGWGRGDVVIMWSDIIQDALFLRVKSIHLWFIKPQFIDLLIKPQMIPSPFKRSCNDSKLVSSKIGNVLWSNFQLIFFGTRFCSSIAISRLVPPGVRQFVDTGNSWDKDIFSSAGKTSSNSKVDIARVHGCWIVWILEWMGINRSMGMPGSCEKPLHSSGFSLESHTLQIKG